MTFPMEASAVGSCRRNLVLRSAYHATLSNSVSKQNQFYVSSMLPKINGQKPRGECEAVQAPPKLETQTPIHDKHSICLGLTVGPLLPLPRCLLNFIRDPQPPRRSGATLSTPPYITETSKPKT